MTCTAIWIMWSATAQTRISYRQLGGEIVTVGSDAHNAQSMAADFDRAGKVLLDCGFRYYTIFEKRTPEFRRI